jgi:stage V sporulation protein S
MSIYDHERPVLRAIGAGAINQAVKAIAIARGLVAPRGIDLTCRPGFQPVDIDGQEYSAMTFALLVEGQV